MQLRDPQNNVTATINNKTIRETKRGNLLYYIRGDKIQDEY